MICLLFPFFGCVKRAQQAAQPSFAFSPRKGRWSVLEASTHQGAYGQLSVAFILHLPPLDGARPERASLSFVRPERASLSFASLADENEYILFTNRRRPKTI